MEGHSVTSSIREFPPFQRIFNSYRFLLKALKYHLSQRNTFEGFFVSQKTQVTIAAKIAYNASQKLNLYLLATTIFAWIYSVRLLAITKFKRPIRECRFDHLEEIKFDHEKDLEALSADCWLTPKKASKITWSLWDGVTWRILRISWVTQTS